MSVNQEAIPIKQRLFGLYSSLSFVCIDAIVAGWIFNVSYMNIEFPSGRR